MGAVLFRRLRMKTVLFCLCVTLAASLGADALQIDVIYESLCPDSTRFISQQIPTMYEAIGQYVEMKFRPYGFATTTEVDGAYQFECQHGERECNGNMDQAGPACFEQFGLDYQPIMDCIESGEGAQLHADYGEAQNSETPVPNNVPWINLGQEHLAEYWELEEYGLLQFICDTFESEIPCEEILKA